MIKDYILYNSHKIGFFLIDNIYCDTVFKAVFDYSHYYIMCEPQESILLIDIGNINID